MRALIIGDIDFLGYQVGKNLNDMGFSVIFVGRPQYGCLAYKVGEVVNVATNSDYGIKTVFGKFLPDIVFFLETPVMSPCGYSKSYLESVRVLLEALSLYGCDKLLVRASHDIYGSTGGKNRYRIKENDSCNPANFLGVHYKYTEDTYRVFCFLNKIKLTSFRIFELYGFCGPEKSNKSLLQSATFFLSQNRSIGIPGKDRYIDFIHVDDAANIMALCLTKGLSGPVNIASGSCRKLSTTLSRFCSSVDKKDSIIFSGMREDHFSSCADISKTASIYKVKRDLDSSIVEMYNSFLGCRNNVK